MNIRNIFSSKKLAGKPEEKGKRYLPYNYRSISRVRNDIDTWNRALNLAQSEEPQNWRLQNLFTDILLDAHLTSQVQNRMQQIFSSTFSLKKANGEEDEEQTEFLRKMPAYRQLTTLILEKLYYGYSLCELSFKITPIGIMLEVDPIPRTNVVPRIGKFFPDYSEYSKSVDYRLMKEYGTWILEFRDEEPGMLNKAVPHVLFKKFAQSCWSELCEIYGIPPRVMKTNTQDAVMLRRAEQMMSDMGAAAWFIIDETETFEWAKAADTNGDVYKNLITLCTNELSLLVSGAVIGQDTQNGSRSKDESAQEMLWQLVQADMEIVQEDWNNIVIPALVKLGILKAGVYFEFEPTEDLEHLWKITREALTYYKVEPKWVKEKFGIEITGERDQAMNAPKELKVDADFFD